jgi:CRISPR-associated protein Csb1
MLKLEELHGAITGTAAAFRCVTEYQPAGGAGSVVFPPTYEGGKYALVGYRVEEATGRKLADQVLLDSVQSQANRMEIVLQAAWEDERLELPVVTVDFAGNEMPRVLRITSLEAPHRIADALIRDSLLDDKPFRKSDLGRRLDDVDNSNATALFELCPTALVFGLWDSTGPKGGLGAKFARTIVSEIVGLNAQIGVKTSSRIDPTQIQLGAGPLYKAAENDGVGWTLNEDKAQRAAKGKREPVKLGRDGRPSEANHGNVTPTIADGGVVISRALQTTVLSLAGLRRLHFPLQPGKRATREVNDAARTALAALGLCGAVLTREQGCDLRSRCQLFPTQAVEWELLDKPGQAPAKFALDGEQALTLVVQAVAAAKEVGLPWHAEELVLQPSPELVALVRKSQELSASTGGEEDE